VYKLKINLFGESQTFKRVSLDPIQKIEYETIAQLMKQPLHQALIDPYFYFLLKKTTFSPLRILEDSPTKYCLTPLKIKSRFGIKTKKSKNSKLTTSSKNYYFFLCIAPKLLNTKPIKKVKSVSNKGKLVGLDNMKCLSTISKLKIYCFNLQETIFKILLMKVGILGSLNRRLY
jgi:hypothetical protein